MCGIAFDARRGSEPVDADALRAAIEALSHRGPDGRYVWTSSDGRIALAHARLTIVDLSPRGNQPMANEDESLWLTCNGEVYNHRELRRELEGLGHRFRSDSDNEVLLHGYEEWGLRVLDRVQGMFAFAIAEPAAGRVVAARDRLGEKPLVYLEDERGVVAASELPALLATGRVSREVDPRALAYFLARNLRHVPEPLCMFRGVRKLPAGHLLVIEHGEVVEEARWWHPTWQGPRTDAPALREALVQAVALEREADVEVGALLSGGVDSSVVVGLAAGDGRAPRTYALGRDADDEELVRARAAAARFGTRHYETTFDEAQLSRLDALIRQLGEPIALLPLTHADALLGQVHREGLRVVLTGNGADELLFGYGGVPRLLKVSSLLRATDRLPARWRRAVGRVPARGRVRDVLRLVAAPPAERKTELYRAEVAAAADLLAPELRDAARMPDRCPVFTRWSDAFDGRDYIELSQFLTLVVEDAHSVTISGDLVGMHHSVEVRSPFLDHRVVEVALRLPVREKAGTWARPEGKRALKRAFADLIGAETVAAPKMGFGFALQESELLRGPFRAAVTERVLDGPGIRASFDRAEVERRVQAHMEGGEDHGKLLLGLYAFETWHAEFLG